MSELLILLALSWIVRKWFVGATPEDVEDFLMCEEAASEDRGED
jgi:hypothetical protein